MKVISTKKIALGGLFMALICVTTIVTQIKLYTGYFNLGDIFVMTAAVLLGRYYGFAVGGIGAAIADLYLGSPIYAPITLIVKGMEAFVIASIIGNSKRAEINIKTVIAFGTGAFIMVVGYFIAEGYLLRLIDKTFGLTAAFANLPFNAIQGVVCSICAFILIKVLARINLIPQDPRRIS
ncbi:MAG TPA: ECF transporter S component [Pseudobacteroides sp.]|uniref:ECF transporter S component n=1 Tax=Pseudobacteroides sp. TaxID=1968840 RepID=UPI002F95047B